MLEKFTMYYYEKKVLKIAFTDYLWVLKGRGKYIYCTQEMGSGKEKGVPQNVNNSYAVGTSIIGGIFFLVFFSFSKFL